MKNSIGDKKTKLLKNTKETNNYQILHPINSGTENLAKDIGKIDNEIPPKFKLDVKRLHKNYINKKSKDQKVVDGVYNSIKDGEDKESGLLKGISRFFKGKPIVKDERNSTKTGLELLKKSGMSDEDLKLAGRNLRSGDDIFEYGSNIYYKTPILNSVKRKKK